jgi:hypothetical protein
MVTRFTEGTFVYPGALFRVTAEELQAAAGYRRQGAGAGWVSPETADDDEGGGGDGTESEAGDEAADGFDHDDQAEREAA